MARQVHKLGCFNENTLSVQRRVAFLHLQTHRGGGASSTERAYDIVLHSRLQSLEIVQRVELQRTSDGESASAKAMLSVEIIREGKILTQQRSVPSMHSSNTNQKRCASLEEDIPLTISLTFAFIAIFGKISGESLEFKEKRMREPRNGRRTIFNNSNALLSHF